MYGKCCVCEQKLLQAGGYLGLGMCGVCATGEAASRTAITAPCPKCGTVCEYKGAICLCYECRTAEPSELPSKPERVRRASRVK